MDAVLIYLLIVIVLLLIGIRASIKNNKAIEKERKESV